MPEEKTAAEIQQEKDKQLAEQPVATAPAAPAPAAPAVVPAPVEKNLAEDPTVKKLTEDVKSLVEQNKKLTDAAKKLAEDKHVSDVALICKELADQGTIPAVVEVAKKYLLADMDESASYKLSEKDEKGAVTMINRSLSEAIIELIEAMPKVQLGESTVVSNEGSADMQPAASVKSDKDVVKKYMEDNKCDYRIALTECKEKGLIKSATGYSK